MATPHLAAEPGDFADTVLLPGDPRRARWIAETFFNEPALVTSVRNIEGFTGTVGGRRVSVLGTGMGIPSISIYATELVAAFGVRNLVRVGSCGALAPQLQLGDIVAATAASTDSNVNRQRFGGFDLAAAADFTLLRRVVEAAERLAVPLAVGTLLTSDLFYPPPGVSYDRAVALGMLAVEMEAAGLYGVAAETGAKAVCLCTVSDHVLRQEMMSPEQREQGFGVMVEIVLEALEFFPAV